LERCFLKSLNADVQSILCIGAHSDDIEIGCGGTILHLLERNPSVEINWIVLSGEGNRANEAQEAADRILAKADTRHVEIKAFTDAQFPYLEAVELKAYFSDLSRRFHPEIVFTHRREDWHQDHKLVAELTWQHFRNQLIFEYEIPKYEGDLGNPNVFVSLEKNIIDRKAAHLMSAFTTQSDKYWFDAELFRSLAKVRGVECRSETGYAEAFHCRKMSIF
jgi:LmbE family N-acetylglucosaminyl deacetylase